MLGDVAGMADALPWEMDGGAIVGQGPLLPPAAITGAAAVAGQVVGDEGGETVGIAPQVAMATTITEAGMLAGLVNAGHQEADTFDTDYPRAEDGAGLQNGAGPEASGPQPQHGGGSHHSIQHGQEPVPRNMDDLHSAVESGRIHFFRKKDLQEIKKAVLRVHDTVSSKTMLLGQLVHVTQHRGQGATKSAGHMPVDTNMTARRAGQSGHHVVSRGGMAQCGGWGRGRGRGRGQAPHHNKKSSESEASEHEQDSSDREGSGGGVSGDEMESVEGTSSKSSG
ncbi:hypothetical protein Vafri_1838, partial [Volvox africanus]